MTKGNILCSWSGGKDSCFALIQAIADGYNPAVLLNVMNEEGKISRSHGLPGFVLQQQATMLGLPLVTISSSWEQYETRFISGLKDQAIVFDLTHAVFGDIDLLAHRDWEEKVCAEAGLQAVLPLWGENRTNLVHAMLQCGIEAIIVSCNAEMGEDYIGKTLTAELVRDLVGKGIDPCGENGEFHTVVVNCPLFAEKIRLNVSCPVRHQAYWFASDYQLQ